MCYYITATLPMNADHSALQPIISEFHLGFTPLKNYCVAAQLLPKEQYFIATRAYCDCNTAIGSLSHSKESSGEKEKEDKKLKHLRKRGWSEAKIKRWLLQQKLNKEKQQREDRYQAELRTLDVQKWISFIRAMLEPSYTQYVGLLLHWYSGNLERERIKILRRESVSLTSLTAEYLLRIDEDVLYEFRK